MDSVKSELEKVLNVSIQRIIDEKNFLSMFQSETDEANLLRSIAAFRNDGALYKLIFSVYAIYEFTVKECATLALHFIDDIELEKLIDEIQMLVFRQKLYDFQKRLNNRESTEISAVKKLTDLHIKIKQPRSFNSNENMIDTKSNLNFETLKEILD
ncbi:TPA: hypothetical protein U1269_001760, partial [Streptococcus suis]|nr:hypothetical protein [Streptococcus suis]